MEIKVTKRGRGKKRLKSKKGDKACKSYANKIKLDRKSKGRKYGKEEEEQKKKKKQCNEEEEGEEEARNVKRFYVLTKTAMIFDVAR